MPHRRYIRVGISGWDYRRGYPPGTRDRLAAYAEWFDTVEVNCTFYRPVPPTTTRAWAARTPPTFRFAVKLGHWFHAPVGGRALAYRDRRVPLVRRAAHRGGQARGRTDPTAAVVRADGGNHPAARGAAQRVHRLPVVVEVRHRSWTDGEAYGATEALLHAYSATWVRTDGPRWPMPARVPMVVDRRLGYFRLHGRGGRVRPGGEEACYEYRYGAEELGPLAQAILASSHRAEHVYFNNTFPFQATVNALMVQLMLGQTIRGTYDPALVTSVPMLIGRVPIAQPAQLPLL